MLLRWWTSAKQPHYSGTSVHDLLVNPANHVVPNPRSKSIPESSPNDSWKISWAPPSSILSKQPSQHRLSSCHQPRCCASPRAPTPRPFSAPMASAASSPVAPALSSPSQPWSSPPAPPTHSAPPPASCLPRAMRRAAATTRRALRSSLPGEFGPQCALAMVAKLDGTNPPAQTNMYCVASSIANHCL